MSQLHLVTAHRSLQRSDAPRVVYCGHDADQARRQGEKAQNGGAFALVDTYSPASPVTRYADPKVLAKIAQKESAEAGKAAAAAAKVADAARKEAEKAAAEAEAAKKAEAEVEIETESAENAPAEAEVEPGAAEKAEVETEAAENAQPLDEAEPGAAVEEAAEKAEKKTLPKKGKAKR